MEVYIFYSSETEPDIPKRYSAAISYLETQDIDVRIVDVAEQRDVAREHHVTATPLILLIRGGEEKERYHGGFGDLKQLLMDEIYGVSALQKMGFREGRLLVRKLATVDEASVEEAVARRLTASGVESCQITSFDSENGTATLELVFSEEVEVTLKKIQHEVRPFISGVFTEAFDRSVTVQLREDADRFIFTISSPDGREESFLRTIRQTIEDEAKH